MEGVLQVQEVAGKGIQLEGIETGRLLSCPVAKSRISVRLERCCTTTGVYGSRSGVSAER